MKFIKFLILLSCLSIILNGCSGFSEAGKVLRNEKSRSTDEFLIKQKNPLTQPPDYQKIPKPGSIEGKAEINQNKIKKMLKIRESESNSNQTKSSSTEESILKQIKR
tara:strand:- start:1584 stop:1904 length:321 start_codon:yes stop_codon:yes gene_type:complete